MKLSLFLLATSVSTSFAQSRTIPDPVFALQSATSMFKDAENEFNSLLSNLPVAGGVVNSLSISSKVNRIFANINEYFEDELSAALNPDLFAPVGPKRQRTCAERRRIFNAFSTLFNQINAARIAGNSSICRATQYDPPEANGQSRTLTNPLRANARAQLDAISDNIVRTYYSLKNRANFVDFIVFNCNAARNDPTCTFKRFCEAPQPNSPTCQTGSCLDENVCVPLCACDTSFTNGKSPDTTCPFTEDEYDDLTSFEGNRARFGPQDLKDCYYCIPNEVNPPKCLYPDSKRKRSFRA